MSIEELKKNNGETKPTVYVAIKNIVFDVTHSGIFWRYIRESYRPDGSYGVFAGHDASVALGKMDLSGKFLDEYGKTEMKTEEIQIMNDWVNFFRQRYKIIARLGDNRKDKWDYDRDSY